MPKTIKELPEHNRLREKLRERGPAALTNDELPPEILQPSDEDIKTQLRLIEAGRILGIRVLDHLIVSRKGYFSFQESGLTPLHITQ